MTVNRKSRAIVGWKWKRDNVLIVGVKKERVLVCIMYVVTVVSEVAFIRNILTCMAYTMFTVLKCLHLITDLCLPGLSKQCRNLIMCMPPTSFSVFVDCTKPAALSNCLEVVASAKQLVSCTRESVWMRDQREELHLSKGFGFPPTVYSVLLQASPPSSALWQGPGAPKDQTSATAPPTGWIKWHKR